MKRDMNLVREILLTIEGHPTSEAPPITIPGRSEEETGYHVYLMIQAGLLEGIETMSKDGDGPEAEASNLTWAGHEFLDTVRDPSRWKDVLSKVGKATGTVTFELVKQALSRMLQAKMDTISF